MTLQTSSFLQNLIFAFQRACACLCRWWMTASWTKRYVHCVTDSSPRRTRSGGVAVATVATRLGQASAPSGLRHGACRCQLILWCWRCNANSHDGPELWSTIMWIYIVQNISLEKSMRFNTYLRRGHTGTQFEAMGPLQYCSKMYWSNIIRFFWEAKIIILLSRPSISTAVGLFMVNKLRSAHKMTVVESE